MLARIAMSATGFVQRLEQKASAAENLLVLLKQQLSSLEAGAEAKSIEKLKSENETLKIEIDLWMKKLREVDGMGKDSAPVPTEKPTPAETAAAAVNETPTAENKPVEKVEKKKQPKAKAAEPSKAAEDDTVDIGRIDLRVGRIVAVERHPDADSLYVEQVDLAEERPRTIVSGLVKHVPIEQMRDRLAVFMCNLKPAKMRGVTSEGMLMCASTPDKVEILLPPEGSIPGDLVTVQGFLRRPDVPFLNPKKKIWETVAPDLKTNTDLAATYKACVLEVQGKGHIRAPSLPDAPIK